MNYDALWIVLGMLLTYLASILMHEVGHILYFQKRLNKKVKLRFKKVGKRFRLLSGDIEDYDNLTQEEYVSINWMGIAFGFIPIFAMSMLFIWFHIFLILPYIAGCIPDLKEIAKTRKAMGKPFLELDDD